MLNIINQVTSIMMEVIMTNINEDLKFCNTLGEGINNKYFLNNKIFRVIGTNFVFLCIVYFFFISNILTNTHDGLWNSDGTLWQLNLIFKLEGG